ncbi:DNA repair protein RecO [Aquimarina agarivorans]|uniref:DNA repair protein RecO n=1 Tax=Aquimarina agarivorans TaxID=980584 RepID=UPI000248FCAC|nr:DNA repair protein RecO [Aquimarina agarivorans]
MQIKTEGIVIHSIRYGEADVIAKIYTKEKGLISYLIRGVLKSKKRKIKPAFLLPFSILTIDASHKSKTTLKRLIDASPIEAYTTLHQSIVKNSMVTFLTEILLQVLADEAPDEQLYEFVAYSILWLDANEEITLFHVHFLLRLTTFLGCSPDSTNIHLTKFDLKEGNFTFNTKSGYFIEGTLLVAFKMLLGTNFDNLKEISLPKEERKQLLNKVLLYYSFHVPGFKNPKSLLVLETLFS